MLRKLTLGTLLSSSILLGCGGQHLFTGDHPPELVGTYHLVLGSSCSDYGVRSDTLILHPDGTFEQHVVGKSDNHIDSSFQHWRYNAAGGSGHITLDKRLEFFVPERSQSATSSGVPTFEDLIVDAKPDPTIVVNPDSDCVYTKD